MLALDLTEYMFYYCAVVASREAHCPRSLVPRILGDWGTPLGVQRPTATLTI
jgi:hypothetical protein